MGRPRRIVEPGGIYHVTSRGSNKQTIAWDDHDFRALLAMLGTTACLYGWRVFAYCLMTNHYHVLVQVPEGLLSEGMQRLNTGYSRRTNARYQRTRHLFANRFGATHVRDDAHLREVARYLPLNPVLAGLCRKPEQWRWSSYRATVGLAFPPPWLAAAELRRLFGRHAAAAAAAYRRFVADGLVRALRARRAE